MISSLRRIVCPACYVLSAAALVPALLAAQQSGARPSQRDSLNRDSVNVAPRGLPLVKVTGTLAPTTTATLGVTRSRIDRAALEAEPARAAVEPLRHATGVHIDEANGTLGPTIIRIRGGEEQFTQVLIDGVSVNENGGFFDWHGLGLVNVQSVDVARGPQSAVYGTSAMSGAVQIMTRPGEAGPVRNQLAIEGDQSSPHGGGWRGSLESQGGNDRVLFSTGLGTASERGVYALPNNLRSTDGSLRIDYLPTTTFAVTTSLRYLSAASLLPIRDPGETRAPLDPNAHQGRDRTLGSVEAIWSPNDRWTHRLTVADYHLVFTYDNLRDAFDTTRYRIGFFNATYHYTATLDRATARYIGTASLRPSASTSASLSYGAELETERLRNNASGDFGPSTLDISRASAAMFAEAQLRAGDQWNFVAGARAQSFHGVGSAFVPRASVVFAALPGRVTVRAAAAGAYAAPNIQVQFSDPGFFVGNPDLKPETSSSVEAGVDVTGERATASATVFSQTYDNLIRVVPFGTNKQINKNIGRIKAAGLELEGTVRPVPKWLLGANVAFTTSEVVDNSGLDTGVFPNGQPLPFRPTYNANGYTTFPVGAALVTLRVGAVGPQTAITNRFDGERRGVAGYHVMGLTATYPVSPALDAYLHADNVLDAAYSVAYDRTGAPRAVMAGIRARMGGAQR